MIISKVRRQSDAREAWDKAQQLLKSQEPQKFSSIIKIVKIFVGTCYREKILIKVATGKFYIESIDCSIRIFYCIESHDQMSCCYIFMWWLVLQIGLFAKITLQNNPNLAVLLEDGETLEDFLALSPEQILLRWFNYQLAKAGSPRRVSNFTTDIKVTRLWLLVVW